MMGPINSGNWKTARSGGFGLLHLAVSLLLFVALTASHGLVSPHWSVNRDSFRYASHGNPLDPGYTNGIESISHVRSRVAAKNVSPWRREYAPTYIAQSSPYLGALSVSVDLPARSTPDVQRATVALLGGPLPRAYDPQGPPTAAA